MRRVFGVIGFVYKFQLIQLRVSVFIIHMVINVVAIYSLGSNQQSHCDLDMGGSNQQSHYDLDMGLSPLSLFFIFLLLNGVKRI